MAASKQAIKSRIASVASTKKITNAMQMVASAKLTKVRANMEKNREYADCLQELLAEVLEKADAGSPALKADETKPTYLFVITSDMGLCGAYNANVFKQLEKQLRDIDHVVVIGTHGVSWMKSRGLNMDHVVVDVSEEDAYSELSLCMDEALRLYDEKKIGSIKVLYTKYINTLTFEPEVLRLLPPEQPEKKTEKTSKASTQTIFEPDQETMMATLLPLIAKSVLYSKYMESKTSEQASRRMAMENATDNAEELEDKLNLEYNRVRQSAITQEITEIVGGANALK